MPEGEIAEERGDHRDVRTEAELEHDERVAAAHEQGHEHGHQHGAQGELRAPSGGCRPPLPGDLRDAFIDAGAGGLGVLIFGGRVGERHGAASLLPGPDGGQPRRARSAAGVTRSGSQPRGARSARHPVAAPAGPCLRPGPGRARMAIKQLTPEQVRTMSLEEKDNWWLENVYRGDMPQLTLRSALTGFCLGGLLSLTNLYIGAQDRLDARRRHHQRDPRVRALQAVLASSAWAARSRSSRTTPCSPSPPRPAT